MANKTPDQLAKLLKFTLERMKEKVIQYTSCGFLILSIFMLGRGLETLNGNYISKGKIFKGKCEGKQSGKFRLKRSPLFLTET